jgi:hypothetical protein
MMSTAVTIDSLPIDILSKVIGHVKLASSTVLALQPCLLVCRKWNYATLPFFYGNIVLHAWNLQSFAERFNLAYTPFVKFLTLRLASLGNAVSYQALTEQLFLVPPIIASFANLSTFSFFGSPSPASGLTTQFKISPQLLISIVEPLPESCVNLEIDTGRFE